MSTENSRDEQDLRGQLKQFEMLSQKYQRLDQEIDLLLSDHGGATENMTDSVHAQYRELARQRDEIASEMRYLEHVLFGYDE